MTRNALSNFLILGLFVTCMAPLNLIAATYYVDGTNGSNSNDGSQASPWRTITYGLSQISGGDTLIIRSGTYAERLTGFPSGTAATPTVVKAYPGETVTIKPSGTLFDAVRFAGEDYVTMEDLIIDGSDLTLADPSSTKSYNLGVCIGTSSTPGSDHIVLRGCEITGFVEGVAVYGSYCVLEDLYIHDLEHPAPGSTNSFHGIYVIYGDYVEVRDCTIRDVADGAGIKLGGGTGSAPADWSSNCSIYNNTVYNNYYGGVLVVRSNSNLIYNNVCYNNSHHGIAVYGDNGSQQTWATDNKIYNNTICANGTPGDGLGYGIAIVGTNYTYPPKNTIIKNNISWNNENGWLTDSGINTELANNHYQTDPQFKDPANGDFHLKSTSPCRDAGVTLTEFSDDYEGDSRPWGSAWDIGADELHPSLVP